MKQLSYPHLLDDIKLSNWDFWLKPLDERDAAFAFLRKHQPVAFFEEGETSFGMPGPGYWAVTRHADVLHASLNPQIFSSAQSIVATDTPPDTRDVYAGHVPRTVSAYAGYSHDRRAGTLEVQFCPRPQTYAV